MYAHQGAAQAGGVYNNGASSSSSLSSSSSRQLHTPHSTHFPQRLFTQPPVSKPQHRPAPQQRNQSYPQPQRHSPPRPPRSSSSSTNPGDGSFRTPTPTLNQIHTHSAYPLVQDQTRYPIFRQHSTQYFDIPSSPEQQSPATSPQTSLPENNVQTRKTPTTSPTLPRLVPQPDKPTLLDRRRESLLKNASLRVHPFIAMGNTQGRISTDASGGSVPACASPVRPRSGSSRDNSGNMITNSSSPSPQTELPSHGRSVSVTPVETNLVSTDRPSGARAHHRGVSESVSTAASPAPAPPKDQPRRALGLVRKISFRSRNDRAVATPRAAPLRTSSANDAELLLANTNDETEELAVKHLVAPPPKLTISTSHNSSLARASSLGHSTRPTRPIKSTRRSVHTAFGTDESPAATPARESGHGQPSTPTRPIQRPGMMPRSPTVGPISPRRASPGSPHRQSATVARRAEREWKAKLAALTAGPPSPGRSRHSNGPRPPPRRVQRPSAPPSLGGSEDALSGRMTQSLSLSYLPSVEDAPISSATYPAPNTLNSIQENDISPPGSAFHGPSSAFNAPSTIFTGVSGVTKSSSTSSISRPRRSPGSSVAQLPGVPEYERTQLSPIQQEPLSPPPPPVTPAACAHRGLPTLPPKSPAPSISGKSIAPSQKTFGPGPSPMTISRTLDWMPDERVVVSRSSVPDLARVSSPPPMPTVPPGMRLAEMTPPAPAPSCTPSPPPSLSHQPAAPSLPSTIPSAMATASSKSNASSLIVPPRRSESRHRVHQARERVINEATPCSRGMVLRRPESPEATPIILPGPERPAHHRTRSREAAVMGPSILPRTTSLQHAQEMASPQSRTMNAMEVDDDPRFDAMSHKLRSTYDLTPGLETGRRPRRTGLPIDDLQRWLAQTAVA